MSRIDELIAKHCPDGVEWTPLGKVASLQRGKRLVRSQLDQSSGFPVYQNSMTPLGYYHESNVKAGTAFVIAAGAAGEVGYSDIDFWAADDVYFFYELNGINQKYLYHFLLMKRNEISSQVRRASIPRLSKIVIERLSIPIPCPENSKNSLSIQTEIVKVLDTFTKLEAELEARRRQYKYYRDALLTFGECTDAEASKQGQ